MIRFRILLRSRFIPRVHGDERTLVKCNYWVARKIELAKRGVYSIRKMDESMVRWFFFFFFNHCSNHYFANNLRECYFWRNNLIAFILRSIITTQWEIQSLARFCYFGKYFSIMYGILIKQFHVNFVLLVFSVTIYVSFYCIKCFNWIAGK